MKTAPENLAEPDTKLQWLEKLGLLFATSLVLTIAMTSWIGGLFSLSELQGEVARRSVHSPKDFLLEDTESTEKRKAEAADAVRYVFEIDDSKSNSVSEQLGALFDSLRQLSTASGKETAKDGARDGIKLELGATERINFERQFKLDLVEPEWDVLLDVNQWSKIEEAATRLLQPVVSKGIIANKALLQKAIRGNGAVLQKNSDNSESEIFSINRLYDLKDAVEMLETSAPVRRAGKEGAFDSLVDKLAHTLIKPNVVFDREDTDKRIKEAQSQIDTIYYQIRRGEVIVRAGDLITPAQARKLNRLRELQGSTNYWRTVAGYWILSTLVLVLLYLFTKNLWKNFNPSLRDLSFMCLTLIGSFMAFQVNSVLGNSLNLAFSEVDVTSFLLATPVAAGGILMQVTLGAPSVFLFTSAFGLLSGVFLPDALILVVLIFLGNIVGALCVSSCSRRSAFLTAGAKLAALNVTVVLCFLLLYPELNATGNAVRIICAIFGGVVSGVLGAGLAPFAEFIGGYITDIKLLELASLDRPLLRDLSLQAPGTWNHSMVMGQMAEAAAESIGANPLLTRVGAYYHDIGKIKKPGYFVENQADRENRHDKLTPSMSALIIRTHVKDGIEMARQQRLPEPLIDFIPQHHGTSLIEFFYDKAVKEAEEGEVVDESHYRYPGPKPQTKETGILMLADGVEASSRTLHDPTPARIQGLVQKIINRVFTSGQLDECELTLKDLHHIAKSFTRVLTGIYHRRIEYSEPAEKVKEQRTHKEEEAGAIAGEPTGSVESDNKEAAIEGESKRNGTRSTGEAAGGKRSSETPTKEGAAASPKEALKRLGM